MPDEDHKGRVDRELIELLNELRVALPGVQVLFAFLLIVPFTDRFTGISSVQRLAYFIAFVCTSAATALLIAPSSYHRLRFRQDDKERMLFTANRLAIAGTMFLAVSISAVVYLVTDVLFHTAWASLVTALNAGLFAWFWYGLAITRPDAPTR